MTELNVDDAFGHLSSISFAFAAPFVIKAAVKLDLFNIISKSSSQLGSTLQEIVAELQQQNPDDLPQPDMLFRLLRFLVFKKVLAFDSAEARYGLNSVSKLLVSRNNDGLFVAPYLLHFFTQASLNSWQHIDAVIRNPGLANAFVKGNGMQPQDYLAAHPEVGEAIENFRVSGGLIEIASMQSYQGLRSVKRLVDVGGGTGSFIAEVVKMYPHIEAFNLDFPGAFGPEFPGVRNIPGNALESVPPGDGMFIKHVLHIFPDAEAAKILRNCYEALEKHGKVIICDMVMEEENELHLCYDMFFLSALQRYERTEEEWRSLLVSAGFESISFHKICRPFSIIEALKD